MNLAMISCGSLDGYFEFGVHSWDMAAGVLIVAEAGGYVSKCDGKSQVDLLSRQTLAANSVELAVELGSVIEDLSKFYPKSL